MKTDKEKITNFVNDKIKEWENDMKKQIDYCGGYVSEQDTESMCYLVDRIASHKAILKYISKL